MFERFTQAARRAVADAQVQARRLSHRCVGTEHLLLGLLANPDAVAAQALHRLGVDPAEVRASIVEILEAGPGPLLDGDALASIGIDLAAVRRTVEDTFGPGALDRAPGCRGEARRRHSRVSPRVKKVLELSLREAIRRHDSVIGTEHILLGLLREGRGVAAMVLARSGVDRAAVEAALDDFRRGDQADAG